MFASGAEGLALGSPQGRLEEDLWCDRRRVAVRLHDAIRAIPLPVLPTGKLTVPIKTPTAGKPRKQAAN